MRTSRACAAAGAYALLVGAHALDLLPASVDRDALGAGLHTTAATGACAVLVVQARRAPAPLRRARALLAAGLLVASLAGLLVLLQALRPGQRTTGPGLDDGLHLLSLLALLAALCAYPRGERSSLRTALDAVVGAVSLWFVVDVLLLSTRGERSAVSGATEAMAFSAVDVVLLAAALSVLARVPSALRREVAAVSVGLLLIGLSDVVWLAVAAGPAPAPDHWLRSLVVLGVLAALAAGAAPRADPQISPEPAWSLLPVLPVLAAIGAALSLAVRDQPLGDGLGVASVMLVGALLLRQVVGTRDRLDMTRRLTTREELFRSLVTGSSDLITLHDVEGRLVYASPAVVHATGIAAADLVGGTMIGLIHPDDHEALAAALHVVLAVEGGTAEVPLRLHAHDGTWRWHSTRMRNALADPSVRGVVSNSRDVHERHVLQQQVAHAASHDALTGLGNLARARALLRQVCERQGTTTVVLVDLDGFKSVNDTFGHADGDVLLNQVAARLRRCVRVEDEVTRIGGDEFLVVLGGRADGAAVAKRVLAALREPVEVAGRPLSIGASIGIATTEDAPTPEELLRNADLAMYASKAAGRGRITWYEARMHESAALRMQVQRGLRRALDDGHLSLHYQPIVQLPLGTVVAVEALLRWDDPELGPIGPDVFIPVAEECGLMGEIDGWVLERACDDLVAWRGQHLALVPVCVNVSRAHLTSDLPGLVAHVLSTHQLPASLLNLEVTESAVVPDPETAILVLEQLRAMGTHISLDDFGTGESSLSQLARLPIDTVKIDKSFVLSSSQDAGAQRLLTSIIGVCRALELPVVAEGIEDVTVVGSLAANGCEFGQGYHFGRPGPASLVPGLLRRAGVPLPRAARDDARTSVA